MAAIDNLNANLQSLNGTVQQVVAKLGQPTVSETAVQAAADQLATINNQLASALNATVTPTP